jgi:hypothetical protein
MASGTGKVNKLKIRSQLDHVEAGGILDDCGPSSAACASSGVLGKDITAAEGRKAKEKATGFKEKQGVSDNGSSLWDLIKTCKVLGANARYPKDWDDCVASAKKGAALIINVDAAKNYPPQAISSWHQRYVGRHKGATYGHMVAAAYDAELGWQFADPTFTGKGKEQFAVLVTEVQLKSIASSKGEAPFKRCIIVKK